MKEEEFMTQHKKHKKVYKSRLKLRKLWSPNSNIKTRPEAKNYKKKKNIYNNGK